jgi:hypothetical protein
MLPLEPSLRADFVKDEISVKHQKAAHVNAMAVNSTFMNRLESSPVKVDLECGAAPAAVAFMMPSLRSFLKAHSAAYDMLHAPPNVTVEAFQSMLKSWAPLALELDNNIADVECALATVFSDGSKSKCECGDHVTRIGGYVGQAKVLKNQGVTLLLDAIQIHIEGFLELAKKFDAVVSPILAIENKDLLPSALDKAVGGADCMMCLQPIARYSTAYAFLVCVAAVAVAMVTRSAPLTRSSSGTSA